MQRAPNFLVRNRTLQSKQVTQVKIRSLDMKKKKLVKEANAEGDYVLLPGGQSGLPSKPSISSKDQEASPISPPF